MSEYKIFTSESVSEGHPDKMADQISDAVLDAMLKDDPDSRVACETLVKDNLVVLAGEITSGSNPDLEAITRKVILDIGYNNLEVGCDGNSCEIVNAIGKQSQDIAQGINEDEKLEQGAGDQGLMFGYATNETEVLMPAPITYSHRLVEQQAFIRKSGKLPCETINFKYDLEYGSSEIEIHKNDIKKNWNVLIHDDLLATGGTACAASELMKELEVKIVAFAFIISFDFLNGNEKLEQYSKEIISLKRY